MRVFLDTNVLFSGLYSSRGPPSRIVDAAEEGRFELVLSVDVLVELIRNFRKKAPQLMEALSQFLALAQPAFVEAGEEDSRARYDAGFGSDAPIVAAAQAADVDYFCTGDRRLLRRAAGGRLGSLRVVSPGGLLDLLEAADHT